MTSKGSDQTAHIRRVIGGFAGRTYHIVGNLMHWLKSYEPRLDFQQCGILTSVDSNEPVQPRLSLETPNCVQSVA